MLTLGGKPDTFTCMKELTHREVASRGGINRAKRLTPEERQEIARKGGYAAKGKPRNYKKKKKPEEAAA